MLKDSIFVTGRADASDEVTALLQGGDDYITKPFPPALLLAHITADAVEGTPQETRQLQAEILVIFYNQDMHAPPPFGFRR